MGKPDMTKIEEEMLCLTVLIAVEQLPPNAPLQLAGEWYDKQEDGCESCAYNKRCMACLING
jgi:hypothetical protein